MKTFDVQESIRQVKVTRSNGHDQRLDTYSCGAEDGDSEDATFTSFQNRESDRKLVANQEGIQHRIAIRIDTSSLIISGRDIDAGH